MNALKKLQLEFPGIKGVITKYTNNSNIMNFLNGLETGIAKTDKEEVLYFLGEICQWYEDSIEAIHSNEYVHNNDEHDRNKKMMNDLLQELQDFDFNNVIQDKSNIIEKNNPLIFLSHRSTDKKYGDALEKLFSGIGIKNEQFIYTSHPLHKIPLDKNIYEYLRLAFNRKLFVIILWSNEYLESPACLNEMGAAWVTQSDYTNIYVPSFDFKNPKYYQCAVDKNKMGAILDGSDNCKTSIIELKNKVAEIFSLDIDEKEWVYLLDQFIEDIK